MMLLGELDLLWALDGWIIVAAALSAASAALLGNFLVLRKMSLLGDAISHAVLPGLAVAFFISDSRSSLWMFVGAVIVGLLTALFTEWIRGYGQVDEGASMGVVFTSLFALGLVMIVQAADQVDLDPGCVLYGAIELTPLDLWSVWGWQIPRVVVVLGVVTIINALFVVVFFKELKLSSFDPSLCTTQGFPAWVMHYLLMTLVAVTAVASFESVGNILVVAMLVVPPAAAYMVTDRLRGMIVISVVVGIAAALLGHLSAIAVPRWFGFRSTSTAGMIAVMTGLLFMAAALFGPRHGVAVSVFRRLILSWRILCEDIVGLLYRLEERQAELPRSKRQFAERLFAGRWTTALALYWLGRQSYVDCSRGHYQLTSKGRLLAQQIVRSHRLWEYYLVNEVGVPEDRIHDHAERLEHFTGSGLNQKLSEETSSPQIDPHGSRIP